MSAPAAKPPWASGRRLGVLLCASGVSFLIMLDANIVAVSLPAIARSLNARFADIEWIVSGYILAFSVLLLPAGALADRYGRKRVLLIGLGVFTAASLPCGIARSPGLLNAARALQGLGAALQLSAALAVLGHEFRGPDRARAFAFWGSVIGVAITAGPVVGGIITNEFGWPWIFLLNLAAAFHYGPCVCQFETGIDHLARVDAHLEVYGDQKVVRVQYDTPYVRNSPIRLIVAEANRAGGVTKADAHPAWGDPLVEEWKAFYENVTRNQAPKSGPADFAQDLELFAEMVHHVRDELADPDGRP